MPLLNNPRNVPTGGVVGAPGTQELDEVLEVTEAGSTTTLTFQPVDASFPEAKFVVRPRAGAANTVKGQFDLIQANGSFTREEGSGSGTDSAFVKRYFGLDGVTEEARFTWGKGASVQQAVFQPLIARNMEVFSQGFGAGSTGEFRALNGDAVGWRMRCQAGATPDLDFINSSSAQIFELGHTGASIVMTSTNGAQSLTRRAQSGRRIDEQVVNGSDQYTLLHKQTDGVTQWGRQDARDTGAVTRFEQRAQIAGRNAVYAAIATNNREARLTATNASAQSRLDTISTDTTSVLASYIQDGTAGTVSHTLGTGGQGASNETVITAGGGGASGFSRLTLRNANNEHWKIDHPMGVSQDFRILNNGDVEKLRLSATGNVLEVSCDTGDQIFSQEVASGRSVTSVVATAANTYAQNFFDAAASQWGTVLSRDDATTVVHGVGAIQDRNVQLIADASAAGATKYAEVRLRNGANEDWDIRHEGGAAANLSLYNAGVLTYDFDAAGVGPRMLNNVPSAGLWGNISDRRVKRNIQDVEAEESLHIIQSLPLRRFELAPDYVPSAKRRQCIGFIAQEVQPLVPEAVLEDMTEYHGEKLLGVNAGDIIYHMYNTVRYLAQRVTTLEASHQETGGPSPGEQS